MQIEAENGAAVSLDETVYQARVRRLGVFSVLVDGSRCRTGLAVQVCGVGRVYLTVAQGALQVDFDAGFSAALF